MFSFFSTNVVGTHQKHLNVVLLMSTHNMFSCRNTNNICLNTLILSNNIGHSWFKTSKNNHLNEYIIYTKFQGSIFMQTWHPWRHFKPLKIYLQLNTSYAGLKFQQMTFWYDFSYFSLKTGFGISCKLSPLRNVKSLFLRKIRKILPLCQLLN